MVRVLIADDSHDMVLALMALLRTDGYETRGVYDGREALQLMEDFEPDAVILDTAMPGMNQGDVARTFRHKGKGSRPMLIAVSSEHGKGADKIIGETTGFDYFLSMPLDANVLLNLLAPLKAARL